MRRGAEKWSVRWRTGGWTAAAALGAVAVGLLLPAPPAAVAGGAVTVWDTSGERHVPCPSVDAADPEDIRGGCRVDVGGREIEIVIRTVVGDMELAVCSYGYDMRVDARGRTYLEGIAAGGPTPCSDMNACYHEDIEPWYGQIEAGPGGRLSHVVDACFDTCMGQFTGELRLGLERADGRWVQVADRALVGDSGYQLDGSWDIEQRQLDIRPADRSPAALWPHGTSWLLATAPVGWPI